MQIENVHKLDLVLLVCLDLPEMHICIKYEASMTTIYAGEVGKEKRKMAAIFWSF